MASLAFGFGCHKLTNLKLLEYMSKEKDCVTLDDDPKSKQQKRTEKEKKLRVEFN